MVLACGQVNHDWYFRLNLALRYCFTNTGDLFGEWVKSLLVILSTRSRLLHRHTEDHLLILKEVRLRLYALIRVVSRHICTCSDGADWKVWRGILLQVGSWAANICIVNLGMINGSRLKLKIRGLELVLWRILEGLSFNLLRVVRANNNISRWIPRDTRLLWLNINVIGGSKQFSLIINLDRL